MNIIDKKRVTFFTIMPVVDDLSVWRKRNDLIVRLYDMSIY